MTLSQTLLFRDLGFSHCGVGEMISKKLSACRTLPLEVGSSDSPLMTRVLERKRFRSKRAEQVPYLEAQNFYKQVQISQGWSQVSPPKKKNTGSGEGLPQSRNLPRTQSPQTRKQGEGAHTFSSLSPSVSSFSLSIYNLGTVNPTWRALCVPDRTAKGTGRGSP